MNNRVLQLHFARKRFGQNFLTNKFIIDSIVAAINPQPGDAMIEIGPGLGALTEPVGACIDCMTVIELDHDLATRLANHVSLKDKLTIYQKDVLMVDFNNIAKQAGKSLRIFGNLPYNISTALMFHLFIYTQVICDMHFMLQKEVANRLSASPGNKVYGRLSIMAQYYCDITPVLEVSSTAFNPEPKVDSALVRLVPHKVMPFLVRDVRMLSLITTQAFNQRRKTLRNSLSNLCTPMQLINLGIDASLRAENISISQYCKLANWILSNNILSV